MRKTAVIAGATGLIGRALTERLVNDATHFSEIRVLVRRENSFDPAESLRECRVDFNRLEEHKSLFQGADTAFCCLGTTMKKAGSRERFYKVDFEYVFKFAKLAAEANVKDFFLVSAMGADRKSSFFYNRVKGETEEVVQSMPFRSIHIMKPSLLLGNRQESRFGEDLGKAFSKVFGFAIPKKYRGIQGTKVAEAMHALSLRGEKGVFAHTSDKIQDFK